MVRHTEKQKAPGDGWYAHSLLIKNNQEKHALNSKTTKKKEKMKEWKKQNKWKQVENSNILQPWWVIARTKKYFFIFFCLSSCSVATALLRLQVSRTEGDCWRDDEKQSHKDLQARQKHGSIYTTHAYTHIDTHTSTHTSQGSHTPILPLSAVSCRLKAGEWHEILQFWE